ncbi:RNA-directed DNA polymerase from mobile element jockey [Caerostris extrusa]|uniref:RNA-directed DNA polymerase from mobile element jockey n=1 Tax=Caerostris extrusa TaxID=172846 RepID=A0AAV4T1C5_CAEEX|nr:RNA-directed DNA polymerase from mobile element jockey [Caerostris extrusa]
MECKKLPSFQLNTKEDADNRINELTNIYVTCLQESSTPKFKPPPIRFPQHIKDAIKLRNYYRRRWQRTRDPEFLRLYYRSLTDVREAITVFTQQRWQDDIEALTPESTSLWKNVPSYADNITTFRPCRVPTAELLIPL